MSKNSAVKKKPSKAALNRIDTLTDADIQHGIDADLDAAPIQKDMVGFRRYRGKQLKPKKVPVSMRLDNDVVIFYRSLGRGWQTKANTILRSAMVNPSSRLKMRVLTNVSNENIVRPSEARRGNHGQFISKKKVARRNIMAGKKSGGFNTDGIEGLAKDKPVVYQIENSKGQNIYTGVAKRGRVEERLKEHLPGAKDAVRGGVKVKIQQKSSIDAALKSEARIIKSQQPSQNKKRK